MSDRVLPRRPTLAVVGKLLNDVITDLAKCKHLVWGLRNGHRYQGNVRIWRLYVILVALRS